MPVLRMNMSECPGNTGDVKAAGYPGILINIPRVIIVNEVVPERLAKNRPSQRCKSNANADGKPPPPRPMKSYRLSSDPVHASSRIRRTSTMTKCE